MLTGGAALLRAARVPLAVLAAVVLAACPALLACGRAAATGPPPGLAGQVRAAEEPVLQAIGAPLAWRLTRGRGVTVGVLDTGVGAGAPDLTGAVTSGPDFTAGVNPPGYRPPHLHGTYIASLIGGHGSGPGHAGGVIGVAPAAKLLSVRVLLDDQEPGLQLYNASPRYADAISEGIRYAVRHGVSVINMSLGSTTTYRALRAAVSFAISKGVVVVAAAGNGGGRPGQRYTPYSYPASYPGVIAVAAVSLRGNRASFSDRNASVEVSAPGVNIVGAAPGGYYLQASGTSPASALVAGVAALIRSEYPRLRPALVAQALLTSTRYRPAAGYSPGTGFGEVNALAALRAAGRIAARHPASGQPATARVVTAAAAPIQVVHRSAARILGYGALGGLAFLGFLAALIAAGVTIRRSRRDRRDWRRARPVPEPGPAAPGNNGETIL